MLNIYALNGKAVKTIGRSCFKIECAKLNVLNEKL